ncbi:MAG TPA: hypothetical protein V6D05_16535, partial [Stenomitos sp.]
ACLLTVLASGLATGCATSPATTLSPQGSQVQPAKPPMMAPPTADRKVQGGRVGTTTRMG